jgi:hypothetical protein
MTEHGRSPAEMTPDRAHTLARNPSTCSYLRVRVKLSCRSSPEASGLHVTVSADRRRAGRCAEGLQPLWETGSESASSASSTASPFALAHSVSTWIGSISVAPSGVSSYSTRGGTSA